MEIFEKRVNGNNYQFVCEYWERYNAWGHKVTLLKNGIEVATDSVRYYNRTWECYTYQTAMRCTLKKYHEYNKDLFISNYKYNNNITKFGKGQKQKVIAMYEKTNVYKAYKKLYNAIKTRDFKSKNKLSSY